MDNPWGDLPSQAPYLLPSDAPYVHAWNELQQDRHDARLYLDYPPEPFLGRLDAPLVLLSANPHFDPADNSTWGRREVVDAALASVSSAEGSSFLWLREELAGTAGAAWWRPRVAQLAQTCAELVDHLLVVEFHGYHSPNWQPLPVTLPSQGYSFSLVRRAMERGAVIVALRAWREWQVAVPGLRHYQKLARTKSAQNSHLTVGNIDPDGAWGLICRALPQRP